MSKSAWFAVLLLLFALPATAEVHRTEGTHGGKPYLELTDHRAITGTVIAINKKTREVKLLNEAGDTITVIAGPHVKNLAKVSVNDLVKIDIQEHATVEIATSPVEKDAQDVSVTNSKPEEQPHGTMTERMRTTATIIGIDKPTGTVTLKGQDGNTFTANPKRKATLDQIKVGDLVVFTAVKTTATSVVKAEAKAAN